MNLNFTRLARFSSWLAPLRCMLQKSFIASCIISCFIVHVSASGKFQLQPIRVKGKVLDEKGAPLPGVTVKVKGGQALVATNTEGRFSIDVPEVKTQLVFTFIGYMTKEVSISLSNEMIVHMTEDQSKLNEVVVVGYGTQKRKLLSTSVSSISSSQLKDISVATPGQALAGQISGVNITQAAGTPGAAPVIRIRGIGSLGAGNSPLYVVDGYPLPNAADFNQINPIDIESIDILKDAAAAAIYGSRGGNGIVIVTTKRGIPGQTKIQYNSYIGIQNVSKKVNFLNNEQFIAYSKESAVNAGIKYNAFYDHPPADLPNINWQDQIFRQALITQHEISASGGSENFKVHISASYLNQEGILKNTDYQRFSIRSNIDGQLTRRLRFGAILAPTLVINQYQRTFGDNNASAIVGGLDPISAAQQMPGFYPLRLPNGDYPTTLNYPLLQDASLVSPNFIAPTAQLDLYKDKGISPRFFVNTYLEYEIIKNLKFKTVFGVTYLSEIRNQFIPASLPTTAGANLSNPLAAGIGAAKININSYNWLSENTINYTKTIGTHVITVLAGYSIQSASESNNRIAGVTGTFVNDLVQNISGAGSHLVTNETSRNTLLSAIGRLNYSYQDKYLLSAAIRKDGSSRFGANNKYGTFPSASLAWRVKEESFMKDIHAISELKIRTSYGLTGNYNIGNYGSQSYATQGNYSFGNGSGTKVIGYAPSSIANNNLTWETNKQLDIGLELGLFDDRIYLTADIYKRNTTNLLQNKNIPAVIGVSTVLDNIGEIQNKGLELALNYKTKNSPLKWQVNANISFNKNNVISLVNDNPLYISAGGFTNYVIIKKGLPLGEFYGYQQVGVYQDQADVNSSATWSNGGSKPGDIKYADVNQDGKIDANDLTPLGSPLPNFTYGLTNSFAYKGFDLNIITQGSQGNKIWAGFLRTGYYFNGAANAFADVVNRWESPSNTGNGWQPRVSAVASGGVNNPSSRYVYDGSFFRIRTVAIGYTIPETWLKSKKIQNIRIYLSGQNLFTFTKYIGYNPEANDNGDTTTPAYGYDYGAYPLARTFSFGLNVGF